MTTREDILERLAYADALGHGPQTSALIAEAVSWADALGDEDLRIATRLALTEAYQQGNEAWKALAPFSWNLGRYQRRPEAFDDAQVRTLHWHFKWAVAVAGANPRVSKDKVRQLEASLEEFYRSGGASMHVVHGERASVAGLLGLEEEAAEEPAGPAPTAAQPADPTAVQNRQDQKEAFQKAGTTETRNSGNLTLPASPYQVMAGTVVAGALVTGIKSDLPGDVIATVTEPVYDTAMGKFLLIPQGSRILGKYNSQVSYGQSRVQVVWNRIVLPDTSSLTLDNLAGTDPAGYAGLEDDVDWHWDRVFAGAALTTLLSIGAELAAPENRQDGDRVIIAGLDSAQDSINQVGQEMTRRNLNIQPTLTQRPGLPVRIIVNRVLVLRPYQPLFFNRGTSR